MSNYPSGVDLATAPWNEPEAEKVGWYVTARDIYVEACSEAEAVEIVSDQLGKLQPEEMKADRE